MIAARVPADKVSGDSEKRLEYILFTNIGAFNNVGGTLEPGVYLVFPTNGAYQINAYLGSYGTILVNQISNTFFHEPALMKIDQTAVLLANTNKAPYIQFASFAIKIA